MRKESSEVSITKDTQLPVNDEPREGDMTTADMTSTTSGAEDDIYEDEGMPLTKPPASQELRKMNETTMQKVNIRELTGNQTL